MEVLLKHGDIVVLQGVVQRQVPVVIKDVRPWSDLVHDWVLLIDADDVLNGLTLIVLLAPSLEEVVVSGEPVEDCLVAVPSAFKERVFTKVVLLRKRLVLVLTEYLEHLKVLHLSGEEDGGLSFEVCQQTLLRPQLEEFHRQLFVAHPHSQVQWDVSFKRVFTEQVQVGELLGE